MDDKEEEEETRKVESKTSHDGTLLMLLLTHIFSARDQSLDFKFIEESLLREQLLTCTFEN